MTHGELHDLSAFLLICERVGITPVGRLPGCWQHPEFAGQRWVQELGISTVATRWCCLSTLVFKVELVDCTSLFSFHVPGSPFASHFRKVAVSCTSEVDNTELIAGRLLCSLCPASLQRPQHPVGHAEMLRRCQDQQGRAHTRCRLCVICVLQVSRVALGIQYSQAANQGLER